MTKSCADRIDDYLENLSETMTIYMDDCDVYEEGNEELPPFYEYGLSFDYVEPGTFNDQEVGYYRYQLSWGGPSDEVRFYPDGKIEYWFLNWFDGASKNITYEPWARWLHDNFADCMMINWDDVRLYDYD